MDTNINVPVCYWNKKLSRISKDPPTAFGNPDKLGEELGVLKRKAEDIVGIAIKRNIDDLLAFLKQTFHPNFEVSSSEDIVQEEKLLNEKNNKANLNLYCQIDENIKTKEKKVCKAFNPYSMY